MAGKEKGEMILTIANGLYKFALRVWRQMPVVCGIFCNVRPKTFLRLDNET